MMFKQICFTVLILALFFVTADELQAQGAPISERDTVYIVSDTAEAGQFIDVQMRVANDSLNVANWTVQMEVDTNLVLPVTTAQYDAAIDDTVYFMEFDFATDMAGFVPDEYVGYDIRWRPDEATVRGFFTQASTGVELQAPGDYGLINMKFQVRSDAPEGAQAVFDLYHDFGSSGGLTVQIYDIDGVIGSDATLRDGTLTIGESVVVPNAPIFDPLTSPVNIAQGQNVNFSVRAVDPDVGDEVTITAAGLPAGATFTPSPATGTTEASGTFDWTPSLDQSGNFTVSFSARDQDNNTNTTSVTIVVAEVQSDLLYTTSSDKYRIQGGIPGTNEVRVPIDMDVIRDVYGVQFDVEIDPSVCRVDSITPTDRLAGFTVYENIGSNPSSIRVISYGLNNEKIVAGTTGSTIMYFWLTIDEDAATGLYPFKLAEAWESVSPDPNVPSAELPFDSTGVMAVDILGDVNLDQLLNVADLVSLVGYIIGDYTFTERNFRAANINSDAEANVVDLVSIMNAIFANTGSPAPAALYNGPDALVDMIYDQYFNDNIAIEADLPADVAGVQLEIAYDPNKVEFDQPELTDRSYNFELKYRDDGDGRMKVLMYFKSAGYDEVIDAGLGEILKLPISARQNIDPNQEELPFRLNEVVLSTPEGSEIPVVGFQKPLPSRFELSQNYPNPFNPRTVIEFEVKTAPNSPGGANVELVVYNLLGQRVTTLVDGYYAPGQYSVEWDGTDAFGTPQASGIYFYSLIAGESRISKKMVLTK